MLSLILQALQALGAVGAVGVTVWAVFFTPIGEEISRRYQAEIADATEQLTESRRDLVAVRAQVSDSDRALATSRAEMQRVREDLASALTQDREAQNQLTRSRDELAKNEAETAKLTQELASLDEQRKRSAKRSIHEAYNFLFLLPAEAQLKDLAIEVDGDKEVVDLPRWWKDKTEHDRALARAKLPLSDIVKEVDKYVDETNRKFGRRGMVWELSEWEQDGDKSYSSLQSVQQRVHSDRQRAITAYISNPETGYAVLTERFTRETFGALFNDDWNGLKARFDRFVRTNGKSLSKPLRPAIQEGSTDADIEAAIATSKQNLADFSLILDRLTQEVAPDLR